MIIPDDKFEESLDKLKKSGILPLKLGWDFTLEQYQIYTKEAYKWIHKIGWKEFRQWAEVLYLGVNK